jgi:MFS family permease
VDRRLAALMMASALVTLDGTAVTLALPAMGRALDMPTSSLHWVSDAPLLLVALLLLPAGAAADRFGHVRVMRVGLVLFAAGAATAGLAASSAMLVASRAVQGGGAACILPAAFAVIRASIADPAHQSRTFGVLAAWTGVAAVVGPLVGGVLADLLTWRAVFGISVSVATVAWVVLLGAGEVVAPSRQPLWPADLIRTRNCVAGNIATFGLYFGVFGLPFVIVLYLQQVLEYPAVTASLAILPLSLMMFFAAPFAKLSTRIGSRALVAAGSLVATVGAGWIAAAPPALPFWSAIVIGTALFGLGVSLAVSPLTHAAVGAVEQSRAGAASALNHAVVRAAGLAGIAMLGVLAGSGDGNGLSLEGFRSAMSACGLVGAACGLGGAFLLKDGEAGALAATPVETRATERFTEGEAVAG